MLLVLSFSKAFGTKKIEFREFTNKCKPGVEQNVRFPELVCWTCLSSRVRFTVHSGRLFFDRVFHIRHVPTPVQSWSVKPTIAFCRLKYV